MDFTTIQLVFLCLIFSWSGFVRSGLGFGGPALSLPLLFLVAELPLFYLSIFAVHAVLFTFVHSVLAIRNVDWEFVRFCLSWAILPKLLGIFGLLVLPLEWIIILIYTITVGYSLQWLLAKQVVSGSAKIDRALLMLGGYLNGVSLVGGALIVPVAVNRVHITQYRDTLLFIWMCLASLKLAALNAAGIEFHWDWVVWLLLPTALGHLLGMRFHKRMVAVQHGKGKRLLGGALLLVSLLGIVNLVGK